MLYVCMCILYVYVPRVEGAPGLVCLAAGREAVADMVSGCLLACSGYVELEMKGPFIYFCLLVFLFPVCF